MNAKAYLLQVKKYDSLINHKLDEMQKYKDAAISTTMHLDGMKVQTTKKTDIIGDAVASYSDIESGIMVDAVKAAEARQEIIKTIEQLPVNEYILIYEVYILGSTIHEAAANMDRSYSWGKQTHSNALKHLQLILDARATNGATTNTTKTIEN